jgi:hypothetical protein
MEGATGPNLDFGDFEAEFFEPFIRISQELFAHAQQREIGSYMSGE